VRRITASGQAELQPEAAQALHALPYPRYYLDFETIQFAVPIWAGTRPYEQLPFQWSCHVEHSPGDIMHADFLDLSGDAPMRRFVESLQRLCTEPGPVVVYNAPFERRILNEAATRFPDLASRVNVMIEGLWDLLGVMRAHYYHPAMHGSWSLKAVLPCLVPELSYAALDEVQDGGGAQAAFLEAIAPGTTAERKEELRRRLLQYCELDTWAMVRMVGEASVHHDAFLY